MQSRVVAIFFVRAAGCMRLDASVAATCARQVSRVATCATGMRCVALFVVLDNRGMRIRRQMVKQHLRLQIHRSFRKPLVIFTPKNLLRHPKAKSQLLEFDDKPDDANIVGVRFKRLIMDASETDRSPTPPERPDVRRIVFCSGKVYYELEAARQAAGLEDTIAIVRVEQLAPFPFDLCMRELKRYPNAQVCATTLTRSHTVRISSMTQLRAIGALAGRLACVK